MVDVLLDVHKEEEGDRKMVEKIEIEIEIYPTTDGRIRSNSIAYF